MGDVLEDWTVHYFAHLTMLLFIPLLSADRVLPISPKHLLFIRMRNRPRFIWINKIRPISDLIALGSRTMRFYQPGRRTNSQSIEAQHRQSIHRMHLYMMNLQTDI